MILPDDDKMMGKRHESEDKEGKQIFRVAKKLGFDKQDIDRLKRLYPKRIRDEGVKD